MKHIQPDEWKEVLNNEGSVGNLVMTDNKLEIVHLSLEKGAEIPLHALPIDVYFFVIEGTPSFLTDENETQCKENDVVFCPANKMRSWKNNDNKTSKILVTKSVAEK